MGKIRSALVYTGLVLGAMIPGLAVQADPAPLIADHATGALKKLTLTTPARPLADVAWDSPKGTVRLADYRGKWVLLNIWAVWCAPCREEMPTLSALERDLGGDHFAVVTLASGPNAPEAVQKFLTQAQSSNLPAFQDPKAVQARDAGIFGMPVTMLVDPEGREVARLIGGADWSSQQARALIGALTSGS
ncbi:TlpA family protein disulfide reductase [Pseudooceanicola sp. CBS1P-1]|uniref:Redoxin domain-containing protein n=1 Tax=Pseudooceanicola albus TaxID=2692189 RepID=A0A6L7G287_9RHOB|nr:MULTISPECIES: TlpA disulfide reductase family protein [Pseudooceanicola]MBT9384831.1 TlpA family protein disulfide reductase [Pseudooceanicola endophyticus]MXN18175.1 redoxin domain-containing protein [Pseudooceanicola albus]